MELEAQKGLHNYQQMIFGMSLGVSTGNGLMFSGLEKILFLARLRRAKNALKPRPVNL